MMTGLSHCASLLSFLFSENITPSSGEDQRRKEVTTVTQTEDHRRSSFIAFIKICCFFLKTVYKFASWFYLFKNH